MALFRPLRGLVSAVLLWFAAACPQLQAGSAPVDESGFYGETPGQYAVDKVDTLELHDAKRGKDLQLRVSYPAAGSGFPVIVWSHGAKGTRDMYQPLIEYWVSHGYVCIQPNHSDSRAFGLKTGKTETFQDWRSRPEDIRFIIDSLAEIERRVPGMKGRMDRSSVGVGGHSFGAHTAQIIGGAAIRTPRSSAYQRFEDNRVSAVLLLSPQGSGRESLLDQGSWDNMHLPAMSLTGSNDLGRTGKNWRWRLEPFTNAPPEDKYLVYIDGAHHGFGGIVGFDDFPNAGPENASHALYVKSSSLAFWDAYLKHSDTAGAYLRAHALSRLSHGKAKIFLGGQNIDELGNSTGGAAPSGDSAQQHESLPAGKIITTFDRDGDARLSRNEMPPRLAPAFEHLDADTDGFVSVDELSQGLQSFRNRNRR